MNTLAIVGTHTGIGKTVASAVLCEALKADYWKPVQAGGLDNTDSDEVRKLISNTKTVIHPESYRLTQPISPHAAARIDGITIQIERMTLPDTSNKLIIETAGGLMSPLNDAQTNLDFLIHFNLPVIVISQNYLGSINHTLLTIEVLKSKGIAISGIIFNGEENRETQTYILNYCRIPFLGRMNNYIALNKEAILKEADKLNGRWRGEKRLLF